MHINYTHNTLTAIYGKEYAKVLATKSTINPYLKEAIDKAHSEATNKSTFKRLVKQYAKLTKSGIDECDYCQTLLKSY